MVVKNSAEQKQIIVAPFDSNWPRQRALLLFLLGLENGLVSDFDPVAETETETEYPLSGSNNFDFEVFFSKP